MFYVTSNRWELLPGWVSSKLLKHILMRFKPSKSKNWSKLGFFANFRGCVVLFGIEIGSLLAVQFYHRTQKVLFFSLASVQYSMSWSSPNWRSSSSAWQNEEDEGTDSRIFRNTEDDDDVEEPPPLLAQSSSSGLRNNSLASSTGSILPDIPTDTADSVRYTIIYCAFDDLTFKYTTQQFNLFFRIPKRPIIL